MIKKYYLDTSIWMDIYEDRKGFRDEPLGDFALRLISVILTRKDTLVLSDLLIKELEMNYSIDEINGMVKPFESIVEKIVTSKKQHDESLKISLAENVPRGDALHAVLARDNGLILVTRDNHFKKLRRISNHYKPEELI